VVLVLACVVGAAAVLAGATLEALGSAEVEDTDAGCVAVVGAEESLTLNEQPEASRMALVAPAATRMSFLPWFIGFMVIVPFVGPPVLGGPGLWIEAG
jgi:hypothetical protein